jgi:hypothetical protein
MKYLAMILVLSFSMGGFAQTEKKNIRYEYKKLERFDFDEIGVEGEAGSPGDISITPRARNEFKNKIPEKQNFNKEMKKAVDGIR